MNRNRLTDCVMKNKNVRWIVSILSFLVLGSLLFVNVDELLRIKVGGKTDMIHSFYELEENSVDVLCVGSSHCYHGIQPNVMWGEYGITSYVLGSPAQPVACSYYLLKEALQYQKPKVVLLETYLFRMEEKWKDEARLRQSIGEIRMGKVKRELVEDFFPDYSWKDKLSYYFPFLMDHSRWSDLKDSDFNHMRYLKGGVLNYGQEPIEEPVIPEEAKVIPDVTMEYLEKIVELCRENGTELVLFATPIGNTNTYDRVQPMNVYLEEYARENGIPFLFYQKIKEAGIDFETDFYDLQHLNSWGTEKISRHLSEWLRQNYGLEDRRGEKGFESWDQDYKEYLEAFEKKLTS